jgi:Zn-dependent alcohol dehydrogenase
MFLPRTITTRALLGCAVAAILSAAAAQADVTIQERMSVNGAGMMKMANMSGTTTTLISGQRARTESDMQFESGLLRTFARGLGQSTEIVRLDQDKLYTVNDKKKT